MKLIWLVKCKWSVSSDGSGKIVEVMFAGKKFFFKQCFFFSLISNKRTFFPLQIKYAQVFRGLRFHSTVDFFVHCSVYSEKNHTLFKSNQLLFHQQQQRIVQRKKRSRKNDGTRIFSSSFGSCSSTFFCSTVSL